MDSKSKSKRLLVGKINGLFGVKGFIKVFSYTQPREKIISYKKWLIKNGDDFQEITLTGRKQGKTIVANLNGINSPEIAEKFLGKEVYIDVDWLPSLDGEYYHYQLEGLQVFGQENEDFGIVKYLFDTGSNTVLATIDSSGKEHMIPFIEPYLTSVDLKTKKIIVNWDIDF